MPQVASQALSLVENPDTTAQELTDLLAKDAALAARVLKIANSAMFSRQREITTLNQAIMLIGFKALKGIIVAATLRQLNKSFGKLEKLIWESSMGTAVAATLAAKKLKKPYVEEIFLLGLLHSLGQIVLLAQKDTASDFKKVLDLIKEKQLMFAEAEQQQLGFSHTLIGALVAKKWNFSAETCQVILHYADPLEGNAPECVLDEKVAVIQLADAVAHCANIGNPEGYPDCRPRAIQTAKYLGIAADQAEKMVTEMTEEAGKLFSSEASIYGA